MKVIKEDEALRRSNSDTCEVLEYSFEDKDIDLCIATITGRYPNKGYAMNTISKALIYCLDGEGKLYFDDKAIEFKRGDSILIDRNEKYYWEAKYAVVSMTCTPAWSPEQYESID